MVGEYTALLSSGTCISGRCGMPVVIWIEQSPVPDRTDSHAFAIGGSRRTTSVSGETAPISWRSPVAILLNLSGYRSSNRSSTMTSCCVNAIPGRRFPHRALPLPLFSAATPANAPRQRQAWGSTADRPVKRKKRQRIENRGGDAGQLFNDREKDHEKRSI
jgi:hypothetical protein